MNAKSFLISAIAISAVALSGCSSNMSYDGRAVSRHTTDGRATSHYVRDGRTVSRHVNDGSSYYVDGRTIIR